MSGSLLLRDYPTDMVGLACTKCWRPGQYRQQFLLAVLAIIAGTIIAAETAELALDAHGNIAKILIPKDAFTIEE